MTRALVLAKIFKGLSKAKGVRRTPTIVPMPVAVPTTAKPTNPHMVSRWPKDQFCLSQALRRSFVRISQIAGSSRREISPVAPWALMA